MLFPDEALKTQKYAHLFSAEYRKKYFSFFFDKKDKVKEFILNEIPRRGGLTFKKMILKIIEENFGITVDNYGSSNFR